MSDFARPLNDQEQVDHFLTVVLKVNPTDYPNIGYKIITCEKGNIDGILNPTSRSTKFRDPKYKTDAVRLNLDKQIVDELFNLPLLDNDDNIKLTSGGARPDNLKAKKTAFILIGLPASGKSSVAMTIARKYGAMIIDSDFAKRKLPEFYGYPWGASIVHEESSDIIFGKAGNKFDPLFSKAIEAKYNVVIPKIGASVDEIMKYHDYLKGFNYDVHLTLVNLPKEKATLRALGRFKNTDRYVPLSLIFDDFSERPIITYFLLKNKMTTKFDSFGAINTDVTIGQAPICTDLQGNNPSKLFKTNPKFII